MSSCQFVVSADLPRFIQVADKPLKLGGKIENLTVKEFQERFRCIYNDGISIDSNSRIVPFSENITGDLPASQLKRQVEKVLKATCEGLVICNMGKFGYGVFASKDIPKNTVVAVYAGTITRDTQVPNMEDHACGYYGTNMAFSTRHHRGISSFMQHLPEEPRFKDAKTFSRVLKLTGQDVSCEQIKLNVELYSTQFYSANTIPLIAIENIRKEYLNFNNIPVIAMVTKWALMSGDQLGFSYGYHYWLSRKVTPEYFDKTGAALSHTLYSRTFGRLQFENFSITGEYTPLIALLNRGRTSVIVMGDDKRPHEISVANLMCALLSANACRVELDPQYEHMLS